jgi:transposase
MPVRHLLADLRDQHRHLKEQVQRIEAQLKAWHARCEASQRLASIPGIGLLTATVGDGKAFANGRQLAAYLGLVPKQASSGGNQLYWVSANAATGICAHS